MGLDAPVLPSSLLCISSALPKFNHNVVLPAGIFPPLPLISLEPWVVFLFTVLLSVCCHPRFASILSASQSAAAKVQLQPIPSQRCFHQAVGLWLLPGLWSTWENGTMLVPNPVWGFPLVTVVLHSDWASSKAWGCSPVFSSALPPQDTASFKLPTSMGRCKYLWELAHCTQVKHLPGMGGLLK